MESISSKGLICIKDKLNIEYIICEIEYILKQDGTFKYVFTPFYNVIDLLDEVIFQGIPGIDLSLRKEVYVRENIVPTFISERVPSSNRENYYELLSKVNLKYMDPIKYLIRTNEKYSGDTLYVVECRNNNKIILDKTEGKLNTFGLMKIALDNIASNNEVMLSDGTCLNDKKVFSLLHYLYEKSYISTSSKQKEGISLARLNGKYSGRKPIKVDELLFQEQLEMISKGKITAKKAASNLGISIDKFYRLRKNLQN